MDANLYNSFLVRLHINSFWQPSKCISLRYYTVVQFDMPSSFNFSCIILYLRLMFWLTCSISVILFKTYMRLC